jgi:hypothetical protein
MMTASVNDMQSCGGAVPRLGITGHVNLTDDSVPLVYEAIIEALRPYIGAELAGVSCVARGADTIFAQAVLDVGGRLDVLIPAADYRATKVAPDHAAAFDALLDLAHTVRVLPFPQANRDAYEAANHAMVACADIVLAVWDGNHEAKQGNTASAVAYAQACGVPVVIVWPNGAERAPHEDQTASATEFRDAGMG